MAELTDGEIVLKLTKDTPANPQKQLVRYLSYNIILAESGEIAGKINLRLGYTPNLVRYGGNIGYSVTESYRGNHYAGKACNLLKEVAKFHGMDVIWITCNPDNWPSRKTCEWIGAELVEVADIPPENELYQRGDRQKCRYRLIIH
jgi:predicted acetyltransferase